MQLLGAGMMAVVLKECLNMKQKKSLGPFL
jgi:hypothetical protein